MFKRNGKNDSLEFCNLPLLNYLICQEASRKCVCVCVCVCMCVCVYEEKRLAKHLEKEPLLFQSMCSVSQSCPTLCDTMNCSTPDFSVLHYLPEFAQTHVHWVNDVIQMSHPLLPPSLHALNLSQHQGLSNESARRASVSASVLPMNAQVWFPLGLIGLISSLYKGLSSLL